MSSLRFALRSLLKSPAFTLTALFTLGIGLSVNGVFVSIANDLFYRPLPATDPDRLVLVAFKSPNLPYQFPLSYEDATDIRRFVDGDAAAPKEMAGIFSGIMAYKEQVVHLSEPGKSTQRTWVHAATDNYFSVLGVQPHLGRFFLPDEAANPGSAPVLVLTFDTWRTRFASDPAIIGKAINVNAVPFTIIGVAPKGFVGASWGTALSGIIPATMLTRVLPGGERYALKRGNSSVFMIGRLTSGATLSQAQAAMAVAGERLQKDNPGHYFQGSRAVVMYERHSRPSPYISHQVPKVLGVLTALGALVLLVALANTSALLYARHVTRAREFAICSALGASRFQLIKRLSLESILLAIPAGIIGSLTGLWLTPMFYALTPGGGTLPPAADAGLDWRPFAITGVLALVVGLVAGLFPAIKASASSPLALMHATAPNAFSRRHVFRSLLVIFQVAISTVVLIGTLAALRSSVLLSHVDLGFRSSGLFMTSFDLDAQRITGADAARFEESLLRSVRALPGVEAASLTTGAPLAAGISLNGGIRAADAPAAAGSDGVNAAAVIAEHSYLSTLGLRLSSGRDFTERDRENAPLVAIVNEPLAKALWPGRDAVGQRIDMQGDIAEVVGVLATSRYYGIQDASRPLLLTPLAQHLRGNLTLVVRSTAPSSALSQQITATVHKLEPELPLFNTQTMEQHIASSPVGTMPFRLGAVLAGIQGSIALILACAGIFSLVAFSVARRTREIGVRVALGASRADVASAVTRHSLVLIGIGLLLGLAAGAAFLRFTSGLLYGGGSSNVLLYAGATAVIAVVALAACCIPVLRALRINPVEALRAE